jgi:hypothetical protein
VAILRNFSPILAIFHIGGPCLGSKVGIHSGGPLWGPYFGSIFGSILGVNIKGPFWVHIGYYFLKLDLIATFGQNLLFLQFF